MPSTKRPLLVSVTQFLSVVTAAVIAWRVVLALFGHHGSVMAARPVPPLRYILPILAAGYFAFTSWALQRRRSYAAHLGSISVVLFCLLDFLSAHGRAMLAVLSHGTSAYRDLPAPYLNYASDRELIAAAAMFVAFNVALAALAVYLLASHRVREFLRDNGLSAA
jgi:hypothetical protein